MFDIALHSGIQGTTETRGIFSQAVPMEVLAAALEEEATDGGRRGRPGAIPDARLTVDGRMQLYDVKLIRFCSSRWDLPHAVVLMSVLL